jgi:hypothetical protein
VRLLVIVILFLPFTAGVMLIFWRRRGVRVTEPSCGKCRYIVHGLEGFICPECGSDLREVGILRPDTRAPLSRGKRTLLWFAVAPLPTFLLAAILMPIAMPQLLTQTQRRVIFCQAPYCNVTLTANTMGKKLIFGTRLYVDRNVVSPPPAEVLFLSNGNAVNATMDVRFPARTFSYRASSNKIVVGKFDAKAVEKWLNDQGFNDPRVADRAVDIVAALDEMGTPAGQGFTNFPHDPTLPMPSPGIAHPTFTMTQAQPNEATWVASALLFVLVWLAGLPFVWRQRSRSMGVGPMSLQNTAETAVLR